MSRAKQPHLIAALVTVVMALGLVPAWATGYAQMINKTGLSPEDVEMAQTTAQGLYAKAGVSKGETAQWSNAQSGASGRVDVIDVDAGAGCVVYRHETRSANNQTTQIDYRRCKTSQGQWELTP